MYIPGKVSGMKRKTKTAIIIAVVAVLMLIAAAALFLTLTDRARYKNDPLTAVSVNPFGHGRTSDDTISLLKTGSDYYMFLPDGSDSSLRVFFNSHGQKVYLNGSVIKNGGTTDIFDAEGKYELVCGESHYSLTVQKSENVPSVFIVTKSGDSGYIHADKDNAEPARVRVYEDGILKLGTDLEHIKGRGNHWNESSNDSAKPYNIKFYNKTSLLGMREAKKWCLLERGLYQNFAAFEAARRIGLENTPDGRFADLYLNGDYRGVYYVCEKIQIAKNRIDIRDLKDVNSEINPGVDIKKLPRGGTEGADALEPGSRKWVEIQTEPGDVSGGYLLEIEDYDYYPDAVSGFVSGNNTPLVLKSPEYASRNEVNYIADYWQEAEDALYSETGYNSAGRHYSDYFDMDSLVRMYIIQEFTKNADEGVASFYFYKDAGGKLFAGPVWDFDAALGVKLRYYGLDGLANSWWANQRIREYRDDVPLFCAMLFRHKDFREAVKKEWKTAREKVFSDAVFESEREELLSYTHSFVMTMQRWKQYGMAGPEFLSSRHSGETWELISWMKARRTALDSGFSDNAAYIRYDSNGGSGHLYESAILNIGDSLTVNANAFKKTGAKFAGWNTEADGSGNTYYQNDVITLSSEYTVLYAQWVEQ